MVKKYRESYKEERMKHEKKVFHLEKKYKQRKIKGGAAQKVKLNILMLISHSPELLTIGNSLLQG